MLLKMLRAQGYKTFFKLNSAEHEILNAHKYKNIKKLCIFSGSYKPRMLFFLLIKVEPTIVGISMLKSGKSFMLSPVEQERSYITLRPGPNE